MEKDRIDQLADHVQREKVWNNVDEGRHILSALNRKKIALIGYMFLRNVLLKQGNEGKNVKKK
jgi:hypothetical protein